MKELNINYIQEKHDDGTFYNANHFLKSGDLAEYNRIERNEMVSYIEQYGEEEELCFENEFYNHVKDFEL